MRFSKLHIKNFRSLKDIKIDLETTEDKNLVIIHGNNGHGKTSILNAIRFALYGEVVNPAAKRAVPMLELLNRDFVAQENYHLQIRLSILIDDTTYTITRSADRKSTKKTPTSDQDFIIHLQLMKNGVQIIENDTTNLEDTIQSLLPKQSIRFVLFDAEILEEYEKLSAERGNSREVKKSIEHVLGVPTLQTGASYFQSIRDNLQSELAAQEGANELIEHKRANSVQLSEKIEKHELEIRELISENTQIRSTMQQVNTKLKELAELDEQIKRSAVIEEKIEVNFQAMVDSKVKIQRDYTPHVWIDILEDEITESRKEINKRIKEQEQEQTNTIKLLLMKLSLQKNTCALCNSALSTDSIHSFESSLTANETLATQKKLTYLQELRGDLKLYQTSAYKQVKLLSEWDKSHEIFETIEVLRDELYEIQANTALVHSNQREQLINKYSMHEESIWQNKHYIKNLNTEITQIKMSIATISQEIIALSADTNSSLSEELALTTTLLNIFEKSIDEFRKNVRKNVNQLASETFRELINNKAFNGVEINDSYGLHMLDQNDRPAKNPSAGQSQIVALSLVDALSKQALSGRRPIFIDSPFNRLDQDHRENILRYIPKMGEQVVLFVTNTEVSKEQLQLVESNLACEYKLTLKTPSESIIQKIDPKSTMEEQ